jgi:hypothetical protein
MKKVYWLFFLLISIATYAQDLTMDQDTVKRKRRSRRDTSQIITQPLRLEIPVKDLNDEFDVVDGYEGGLLVVQNTNEQLPNGSLWEFHLVNNDLEVEWKISRVITTRSSFIGYDYNDGFFFLLFDNSNRFRGYQVMVIDVNGESALFHEFEMPFDINLQYFEALDNGVLMVGSYNMRPVALIHDLVNNTPKVLPGFYNYNEQVFDLVMDEPNRAFSIVLAEKMRNGKYTNRIKSFTYDGLLITENLINPGEDLSLVDGTTTNFGNGTQFMAGTYSLKTSLYSRGIYISKFTNGQQRFLKNYNYGELSNFFSYRGKRAADRIKRKASRKKAKGKEKRFNYRLYIHEIVPKGDVNILIAEAYYARYSSSSNYNRMGFGNPYAMGGPGQGFNYQTFLGYKYTHAIIVAFDANGDVIWDNSFRTNDITSFNLQESVAVNVQGDKAAIMYLDDGRLKSKVIQGDDVLEDKTINPVKLKYPGDKESNRDNDIYGVYNWYDNYLFSYGIQKIKNKSFPKKERKRRVFYLNKIQFDKAANDFPGVRFTNLIQKKDHIRATLPSK